MSGERMSHVAIGVCIVFAPLEQHPCWWNKPGGEIAMGVDQKGTSRVGH